MRPVTAATYLLAITFMLGLPLLSSGIAWTVEQYQIISGTDVPVLLWPAFQLALLTCGSIVTLVMSGVGRHPSAKAANRLWWASLLLVLLLTPVRFVPATEPELAALLQTAMCVLAFLLFAWWLPKAAVSPAGVSWHWAAAFGLVLLLPWLATGAFGSPLETMLNFLACLALAVAAGRPLALYSEQVMVNELRLGARLHVSLVAGAFLAMVAGGFAVNGGQLALVIALPAAALLLTLPPFTASRRALTPVLTLAAFGPSALVDAEEVTFALYGAGETMAWLPDTVFSAVSLGIMSTFVLALLYRLLGPRLWCFGRPVAVLTLMLAVTVYFGTGQPGFFGERLFVVLKDQATVELIRPPHGEPKAPYVYSRLTAFTSERQASLTSALARLRVPYRSYYLQNAIEVDAGPLTRWWLQGRPDVDRVLPSPRLRPLSETPTPAAGRDQRRATVEWNITMIGAPRVWQELGVTGKGIVVGHADSGVDVKHPQLAASYRGATGGDDYNWLNPWSGTSSPRDIDGHGTHTLGTVVGADGLGVAPGAQWFACSNLERNVGNPALYLDCLQFMLAPYPQGGDPARDGDPMRAAHVVNNSWLCPPVEGCDASALQLAAMALREAGVFMVASAGNEGPYCGSLRLPLAIYDEVFSVGSVDSGGKISYFSSRGPVGADGSGPHKPDIMAPGSDVLSAAPNATYARDSGTSMAAPHVAGVVALMWSANPVLIGDVERTEDILRQTATLTGAPFDTCDASPAARATGIVNAYEAVLLAQQMK